MKSRLIYLLLIVLIILLGLSTRRFINFYPDFVAQHFGDALWASMVYFGFRFLFFHKQFLFSTVLALIFSFLIEFSQLYQAQWILEIRATTLGALVFGHGFLPIDFIRYTAGVIGAMAFDFYLVKNVR